MCNEKLKLSHIEINNNMIIMGYDYNVNDMNILF